MEFIDEKDDKGNHTNKVLITANTKYDDPVTSVRKKAKILRKLFCGVNGSRIVPLVCLIKSKELIEAKSDIIGDIVNITDLPSRIESYLRNNKKTFGMMMKKPSYNKKGNSRDGI